MDYDLILDIENEENNYEQSDDSEKNQKKVDSEKIKPEIEKHPVLAITLISSIALIWAGVFIQGMINGSFDNPSNLTIARTGLLIYVSGSIAASLSLLLLSIRSRASGWIRSGGIATALLLLTWTFLVIYYLAPAVFF